MASTKSPQKESMSEDQKNGSQLQAYDTSDYFAQEKEKKKKRSKTEKELERENLKRNVEFDEHKIPLEELEKRLETNLESGLTPEKAKEELLRMGPNALSPPKTEMRFCKHLFGCFSILLWIAAILCFIAYSIQASTSNYAPKYNLYLRIVLIAVVVVTGFFSSYQEAKGSRKRIMKYCKSMAPQSVVVIRSNEKLNVLTEELVVGDIIEVKSGDLIPADIRIITAHEFKGLLVV